MDTIGGRVRHARQARAMSQEDLSKVSGVEAATICRIERDKATPRPSTIRKLAAATGTDPGWLLLGEQDSAGQDAEGGFSHAR